MKSAHEGLRALREGNQRFVAGTSVSGAVDDRALRGELASGQAPFAVVVGCSDSRVTPETVFDQSLGDLFVVRVAGHVLAAPQVGSVEFAVQSFGTPLVVVLGHTRCGAVAATLREMEAPSVGLSAGLAALVEAIRPTIEPLLKDGAGGASSELSEHAVRAHVQATVTRLKHDSQLLSDRAHDGELHLVGAVYSLDSGQVEFF